MAKKLSDIKPNKDNPRRIKKDRQEKLAQYLAAYGDLSGVVYNTNPECEALVSGHQRTAEFKRQKAKLTILERYDPAQPDGTTARGFLETPNGQRYTYREVKWDKEKADAATIIANGQFGEWDSDILESHWGAHNLADWGVTESWETTIKKAAKPDKSAFNLVLNQQIKERLLATILNVKETAGIESTSDAMEYIIDGFIKSNQGLKK